MSKTKPVIKKKIKQVKKYNKVEFTNWLDIQKKELEKDKRQSKKHLKDYKQTLIECIKSNKDSEELRRKGLSELKQQKKEPKKPDFITRLRNIITDWGLEIQDRKDREHNNKKCLERLPETISVSIQIESIKRRIRDYNKQLSKLSRLQSKLPKSLYHPTDTNKPSTWLDYIVCLFGDRGNYSLTPEQNPLNLESILLQCRSDNDIDSFFTVCSTYLELEKRQFDDKTKHLIGFKMFHECIDSMIDSEHKEREQGIENILRGLVHRE